MRGHEMLCRELRECRVALTKATKATKAHATSRRDESKALAPDHRLSSSLELARTCSRESKALAADHRVA